MALLWNWLFRLRILNNILIIELLNDLKWFEYICLKFSLNIFALDLDFNWIYLFPVFSHQKRAKSQLWISGLYPSAYWFGQALVDISFFVFFLFSMLLFLYVASLMEIYITSGIVFALVSNTLYWQYLKFMINYNIWYFQ